MRAVPAPRQSAPAPVAAAAPPAAVRGAPAARKPGHWITGKGESVAMRDMNPWHRENAIRKARAAGDDALAAELETSRPEGRT